MNKKLGFTLIEMLVVVTVIGIVLGVLLTSYQGTQGTARDGRRKADLESIKSSLEIYRSDCGTYPGQSTFQGILDSGSSLVGPVSTACAGNTYMAPVPKDPLSNYKYIYILDTSGNSYTLCAHLEDEALSGSSYRQSGCGTLSPPNNYGNCLAVAGSPVYCNYKIGQY